MYINMANGVHKYAHDLVGTLFKRRIIAIFFNNWKQLTKNDGKTGMYINIFYATPVFDKIV